MNSDTDFYNSLELSLKYAESLLEDAVSNSKSIFHSPTLSILDKEKKEKLILELNSLDFKL